MVLLYVGNANTKWWDTFTVHRFWSHRAKDTDFDKKIKRDREKLFSLVSLPPPGFQNPSFTVALLSIPVTGSSPAPVATHVPSVL